MRGRRPRMIWRTVLNPQAGPAAPPPANQPPATPPGPPTTPVGPPSRRTAAGPDYPARTRANRGNFVLLGAAGATALILLAGALRSDGALFAGESVATAQPTPVGLIASPVVMAVDRRGNVLPVDPAEAVLDLPVLRVMTPGADALWGRRVLARDAGHMAEAVPDIFAVISEARIGDRDVTLLLGDAEVRVRYGPPINEMRLRDAIVALNDAVARLEEPPREIDVRFADQVVVRTR